MQLKFDFTTNGKPRITVDASTYFVLSNKALSNNPPWETLFLQGYSEFNYKGTVIKERFSENVSLDRLQFKNKTKKCIDPTVLKTVLKIIKKYVTERGVILASSIDDLKAEIETPFDVESPKKRTKKK